jgi:hypothetical protein
MYYSGVLIILAGGCPSRSCGDDVTNRVEVRGYMLSGGQLSENNGLQAKEIVSAALEGTTHAQLFVHGLPHLSSDV